MFNPKYSYVQTVLNCVVAPLVVYRLRLQGQGLFPTRNPDISFVSFVDVDLVWDMSWVRCDGYVWGCEIL